MAVLQQQEAAYMRTRAEAFEAHVSSFRTMFLQLAPFAPPPVAPPLLPAAPGVDPKVRSGEEGAAAATGAATTGHVSSSHGSPSEHITMAQVWIFSIWGCMFLLLCMLCMLSMVLSCVVCSIHTHITLVHVQLVAQNYNNNCTTTTMQPTLHPPSTYQHTPPPPPHTHKVEAAYACIHGLHHGAPGYPDNLDALEAAAGELREGQDLFQLHVSEYKALALCKVWVGGWVGGAGYWEVWVCT